jgi:flagellar biosynthesis GTPase FlhF
VLKIHTPHSGRKLVALKNQNRKREYAKGVPVIRAKKEMGRMHAVVKSIAVGKLGKHLSAPAWAILFHAVAWSTWDGCEYRSGIRSIGTAMDLDSRQVKRGMSELVALGIFTPQDRSPTASKREATVYIVSVPKRFDDGRLQLITGEVAPAKHAGRTARNAKNPNSATLLKVKNKTKSVAVLMSETKAAKAALLKHKQEQNVERARVEQAKQEQERLEKERLDKERKERDEQERQRQRAQWQEQEQLEKKQAENKRMNAEKNLAMRKRQQQERLEKINNATANFNTLESFQIIYKETQGSEAPINKYQRWQTDDMWRESMILEAIEITGAIEYGEVEL